MPRHEHEHVHEHTHARPNVHTDKHTCIGEPGYTYMSTHTHREPTVKLSYARLCRSAEPSSPLFFGPICHSPLSILLTPSPLRSPLLLLVIPLNLSNIPLCISLLSFSSLSFSVFWLKQKSKQIKEGSSRESVSLCQTLRFRTTVKKNPKIWHSWHQTLSYTLSGNTVLVRN